MKIKNFLYHKGEAEIIMNLFISDLDGTLLNHNAQISRESIDIINQQIEKGSAFTIATARTPLSALPIINQLKINYPIILMNGALIYSTLEKNFLHTVEFGEKSMRALVKAERLIDIQGMLFWIENDRFCMQLGNVNNYMWDGYFDLDKIAGIDVICPQIRKGSSENLCMKKVVYALYMDNVPDKLELMCQILRGEGFVLDLYKDKYTKERWCLEISSAKASKGEALKKVKKMLAPDYVIGFGDNWNDISLFEYCDEGYAVDNASEVLKKCATGIIKSNVENGVALFMKEWNEKNTKR